MNNNKLKNHYDDDKLKSLAKHKKISVNKLMDKLSTQALAEFDSEIRFRL